MGTADLRTGHRGAQRLVAVGLVITEIALWGLRQQARAARRAGYLDGVLESADLAAGADVVPGDAVGASLPGSPWCSVSTGAAS